MLVNLTKHTIDFVDYDGEHLFSLKQAGTALRCSTLRIAAGSVQHEDFEVPVIKKIFTALNFLPPKIEGVYYVVSATAAQMAWAKGRDDVLCPGEPFVVDGRPIGTAQLCMSPTKEGELGS